MERNRIRALLKSEKVTAAKGIVEFSTAVYMAYILITQGNAASDEEKRIASQITDAGLSVRQNYDQNKVFTFINPNLPNYDELVENQNNLKDRMNIEIKKEENKKRNEIGWQSTFNWATKHASYGGGLFLGMYALYLGLRPFKIRYDQLLNGPPTPKAPETSQVVEKTPVTENKKELTTKNHETIPKHEQTSSRPLLDRLTLPVVNFFSRGNGNLNVDVTSDMSTYWNHHLKGLDLDLGKKPKEENE